jgi:hypothetical protein
MLFFYGDADCHSIGILQISSEVLRQSAFPDLERLFLPCGCLERPVRHDIINKPPASAGRR